MISHVTPLILKTVHILVLRVVLKTEHVVKFCVVYFFEMYFVRICLKQFPYLPYRTSMFPNQRDQLCDKISFSRKSMNVIRTLLRDQNAEPPVFSRYLYIS